MITIDRFSSFVEQGDPDGLEAELRSWLQRPGPEGLADEAREKFAGEAMCQSYRSLYREQAIQ